MAKTEENGGPEGSQKNRNKSKSYIDFEGRGSPLIEGDGVGRNLNPKPLPKVTVQISEALVRKWALGLGFLAILASVSLAGWLLSRWRLQTALSGLAEERLRAESLEAQISDMQKFKVGGSGGETPGVNATGQANFADLKGQFTLIPTLDADELLSSFVEISEIVIDLNPVRKQLSIQFDLVRKPPRTQAQGFYWIGLLHGPQGIKSFPAVFASRGGDPILFHRGELLEDVRSRRSVNKVFDTGDFLEKAQAEPVFLTLLVFDNKGNLLTRKRVEPVVRRAEG